MLSRWDVGRRALVHLALNLSHYAGAVWGIGLRFDPVVVDPDWRSTWPAIEFWLATVLYGAWHPSALYQAGEILFWISPIWAIAAAGAGDPVFEYRGYGAHLGLAMMFAAVVPEPWLEILVAWWATQSFYRSGYLRDPIRFWSQVIRENRGYGQRGQVELARALVHQEQGDPQ